MTKLIVILMVAGFVLLGTVGCQSSSGSREYIPGKGWVPND
jgi:hypothetical protein